ncbi:UvrD-helicase domain-containing protein [Vibrio sp. SCSIO 43140]|uniref:UvrD-helicase domain-containing protein n=1 Tax=Vibrio sp. SCSIO 43140 TaxID=2819100 RepID=UPI0020754003|nr:UvrD-helicase domain-containing protein [Vibrio sp. SCSIO 43140]USD59206.1 UvrD-helicase domain-containing protein [Vibrio sp. SCSIO 43140]
MTQWTLTTNSFGRVFNNRLVVEISEAGIRADSDGEVSFFKWEDLDSAPSLKTSITGGCLSFSVKGKPYRFSTLSYFLPFKYPHRFFPQWANQNAQHLAEFLGSVENKCQSRFFRDSSIRDIQSYAKTEYKRWRGWNKALGLSDLAKNTASQLSRIASWKQADIENIRREYVERELNAFDSFFSNVESNPLTAKQRVACITDNDNNLLLAGAGTGKTSVMVGKTGYLVKSGQARPNDILMLAYGRIAAEEMDERIKEKLGFEDVKASTFHSLGVKIISQVEGKAPSLSPLEGDVRAKVKWMNEAIASLMQNTGYKKALLDYFSAYYFVDKDPFEFKTQGEYLKYLNDNDIRTLKGEQVKSFGEMVIANWLYRKGINYQYEAKYRIDVATEQYRQYEPDFYLPDYDIYIEYYGTDEDGNPPPYIDKERYQQGIEWKRKTHAKHGTGYVELYYHQHRNRSMLGVLERELVAREVNTNPLPDNELLDNLEQTGQVTELARLLGSLVDLYKAACLDDAGIQKIIKNSLDPKQTAKALELLMPLYQRYQDYLMEERVIDFNDMISKALSYVETGQFQSPWSYILVDEFQDISEPRARLVKALRDNKENSSLFCVGDDWQAIYRFSGADVRLTTDFEKYFGATSKTTLDMTFRFNSSIGDVATRFVTQNPVQLKKEIKSLVQVSKPAVSIIRQGAEEQGMTPLDKALTSIANSVVESSSPNKNKVYLLARFWYQMPDANYLQWLRQRYHMLDIENQSFHASKGKEADYVVVMGLTTGKHGFPSEKQTPTLINALLPQGDTFEHAEERRLFYVALTRAKHRAYLLADMTDASDFITELIKGDYPVETNEFDVSLTQLKADKTVCHSCKVGVLKPRVGQYGKFMSCTLFPRCKHKETPCDKCGSPMTHDIKEGYQVCINSSCEHERPVCLNCGSEMKLRRGKYGAFWGCSTYRRNIENNCSYKINAA